MSTQKNNKKKHATPKHQPSHKHQTLTPCLKNTPEANIQTRKKKRKANTLTKATHKKTKQKSQRRRYTRTQNKNRTQNYQQTNEKNRPPSRARKSKKVRRSLGWKKMEKVVSRSQNKGLGWLSAVGPVGTD